LDLHDRLRGFETSRARSRRGPGLVSHTLFIRDSLAAVVDVHARREAGLGAPGERSGGAPDAAEELIHLAAHALEIDQQVPVPCHGPTLASGPRRRGSARGGDLALVLPMAGAGHLLDPFQHRPCPELCEDGPRTTNIGCRLLASPHREEELATLEQDTCGLVWVADLTKRLQRGVKMLDPGRRLSSPPGEQTGVPVRVRPQ